MIVLEGAYFLVKSSLIYVLDFKNHQNININVVEIANIEIVELSYRSLGKDLHVVKFKILIQDLIIHTIRSYLGFRCQNLNTKYSKKLASRNILMDHKQHICPASNGYSYR